MIGKIIFFAGFAGITVFIGGVLGKTFNHHVSESPVKQEITHSLMAFGGGIILSAVALVLIPKGMEEVNLIPLCVSFLLGAIIFFFIDRYLARQGGKLATLLAMLMDFVPESIALGAIFATETSTATLLAVFIGLQNLPEAFNSFRDMVMSGFSVNKTLVIFFILSFSGIFGALLGYFFLSNAPTITAYLMIFASGGILYLIFQDIAPASKIKGTYITSLGATAGFLVGIIGEKLV